LPGEGAKILKNHEISGDCPNRGHVVDWFPAYGRKEPSHGP